jgi:hypothetical protein
VNQHYQHRQQILSDIHPNIAKILILHLKKKQKIEFKIALRKKSFSMFPKKLRIAEHIINLIIINEQLKNI